MKLAILGGGGHAKVVAATAIACGHELVGFFDDDPARWHTRLFGALVTGPLDAVVRPGLGAAVQGIGSNETRRQLAARFTFLEWLSLVHPAAWVDASATIGAGTAVLAGALIQPDTSIGVHAIVNTAASVDHDCVVGDYVHLAPGVHLGGHVRVGQGAFLGIGAVAIPRVTIGEWAIVGAGAVVTRDVPPNATVAGVPARPIASSSQRRSR